MAKKRDITIITSGPGVEPGTAHVPLTLGMVAVIDVADIPLVDGRFWKADPGRNGVFYASAKNGRRMLLMHRVILGLTDPKVLGDHRDADGLNNRRKNLRTATHSQNGMNRRCARGALRGVSQTGKTYRAQIQTDKRRIVRHGLKSLEEAQRVWLELAREHFGEFLNEEFKA